MAASAPRWKSRWLDGGEPAKSPKSADELVPGVIDGIVAQLADHCEIRSSNIVIAGHSGGGPVRAALYASSGARIRY